ncbi:MHC class Ia alpha antigen [Pelobates cultripes]|uniref:MHC class Ia alpha antigen n=1 Tax=Pelobates cultripes TaxID=61616 RepID=A0AAD1SY18_PELCU|nr:MHC class Ia alpha antigen [Pelobates cultripes]
MAPGVHIIHYMSHDKSTTVLMIPGFHTFQAMYGCELRDDGSTRGYWQYSYDGKGFLALDMQHGIYIPLTDQAQLSAYRWNSPEVQGVERAKYYLQTECIEWLKKYIEHGKEELDRRNPPQVIILSQQSYGFTKLHCQVYGFYPQDIDVTWKRNGIEIPLDEAKQILPNTDGTYQIRITVKVPAREKEGYACYVVHSSLTETLTVKWDPITDIHPAFKIATLTAALVVVIIVCIVIILVCLGQLRVQAPNLY